MSRSPHTVNVIDLEATCWEGEPPVGQHQEIIEIGLAVVEHDDSGGWRLSRTESMLVEPVTSEISSFCESLTGLTSDMIDREGIPLDAAFDRLRDDYDAFERPFVSWGDFDRRLIRTECERRGLRYPFNSHVNLKTIDALDDHLRNEKGMMTSLRRRDIDHQGDHHRGIDDARNIAKIFMDIF